MRPGGRRGPRVAWLLVAVALVGTLALAGCSLGSTSAAVGSGPPPDAATVVQRVKSFAPSDISFKAHIEGTSGGKTLSGGATGQLTTNPERADLVFNYLLDGHQISFEVIEDQATKAAYFYYTIPTQLHTGLWEKQTAQSGNVIDFGSLVSWTALPNLTMVGPDTVNGLSVWHLRGSDTSADTPEQDDIYVGQDDYRPVQVVTKTTGTGTDALTLTATYTAFNSGVHIDLPPATRVQGG